jgi:anaphase-promoting complex subunit 11
MKITYTNYRAVAMWHWDVTSGNPSTTSPTKHHAARVARVNDDEIDVEPSDDDSDDDANSTSSNESDYGPCAICHSDYDSACPTCKVPGDDCPLSELYNS